ncbi:hypothetical protein KUCAC02_034800 [Chaenocephalus aceratus]|nr:hypothetical protein KUCAC02_034800 [Chaenocephalus aceratus]
MHLLSSGKHVGRRRDVRYGPREGGSEHRGRSRHDPSAQALHQEDHRDFSNLLGDVSNPRTPHDAEYHYYGARDPLHPNTEPEHFHRPPPERRPPLGPSRHTQSESRLVMKQQVRAAPREPPQQGVSLCRHLVTSALKVTDEHHVSLLEVGEPPAEKSKLMRERAQSYQEALRLQVNNTHDLMAFI